MISVEAWTTIRYLKAQGLGTRTIAKEVGVARNTVKHALCSEGPPKYQRQPRPNPKLEPFREEVRQMLTNDHFKLAAASSRNSVKGAMMAPRWHSTGP